MKCESHNSEATAVCPYCGKALCSACSRSGGSQRAACSEVCAAALARADRAAELVVRKSVQMARASEIACYLCGALFVVAGIGSYFSMRGFLFLPLFASSLGVAMIICGYWYGKAAKQQSQ